MTNTLTSAKRCPQCGVTKPLGEFYRCETAPDGKQAKCKVCDKARRRERYLANPERERANALCWNKENPDRHNATCLAYYHRHPERMSERYVRLLYERYGLSPQDYYTMLAVQNGKCAICGSAPSSRMRLHVDHCHKSGKVRALLCSGCNTAIGMMGDDTTKLRLAIKYLEAHSVK